MVVLVLAAVVPLAAVVVVVMEKDVGAAVTLERVVAVVVRLPQNLLRLQKSLLLLRNNC